MIVTITSWAPVLALSAPTIQPITAPPMKAPITHTIMCTTGGMLTAKPSQVATMAPPMNWPVPPMLNRPARNATATPRPVNIRGVALTAVSDSGFSAAATEPLPVTAAEIACGLKIDPSRSAE